MGVSPFMLTANLFKNMILNSGHLLMLPGGRRLYQISIALLKIKWKALHFTVGKALVGPYDSWSCSSTLSGHLSHHIIVSLESHSGLTLRPFLVPVEKLDFCHHHLGHMISSVRFNHHCH